MGIEWELQAMIAGLVGYQMAIFGTVTSGGSTNNQPLIIIAFLCYTPAAFLIAAVKFADIGKHIVISILEIVLLFVAGLFYVIGVAVWGGEYYSSLGGAAATLDIFAAFLALVAGVCCLLAMLSSGRGGQKVENAQTT